MTGVPGAADLAAGSSAGSVLVTRPSTDGATDPLAERLAALGFRVLHVPTVATAAVPAGGPLDEAAGRLRDYDWVVVTSAAGVRALVEVRDRLGQGAILPQDPPRWAAVGQATARSLSEAGISRSVLPAESRASAIPAAIGSEAVLEGARVLLARADAADGALPAALRSAGAGVVDVAAYRTLEGPPGSAGPLGAALDDSDLRAVVVASGSAVRGLVALAEGIGRRSTLDRLAIVSIGPATSAVVVRLGLEVAAEAADQSVEGLAQAVASLWVMSPPSDQPRRSPVGRLPLEVPR